MGAGGANSLPAQGLCLLEHGARHMPVLDLDHQDLTLSSDPYSGALKGRPAPGHGLIVQEHMDNTPALTREGREATDTDTSFASDLPQPGKLTRPVLENHRQIRGHRILILPPRPAPGQSGRTGRHCWWRGLRCR